MGGELALPWFALALAALLRREGRAVSLLVCEPDELVPDRWAPSLRRFWDSFTVARAGTPAAEALDDVIAPAGLEGATARFLDQRRERGGRVTWYQTRTSALRVVRGDRAREVATAFTADAGDFAVWSRLRFDVVAADPGVRELVAALALDDERGAGGRPLIATSLAPAKIERQQAAVRSWIEQGFDVVSVNVADEIGALSPQFPGVAFRVATRDARAMAGKPLVALDDVLGALRAENRTVSAIVNSDIVLAPLAGRPLGAAVASIAAGGFAFSKRLDQETEADPGVRYEGGIDAFFFGRMLLFDYPATPYYLGLPWWDYFFALYPLLAGHPTVELREPIALHLAHKSFYDIIRHWLPLAIETQALMEPLLASWGPAVRESGMELALRAIARVATSGDSADQTMAIEHAYTLYARSMMRLLAEALAPRPGDRVAPRVAVRGRPGGGRLRLGIATVSGGEAAGGAARIAHLVAALAALPADERPRLSLVVRPEHASGAAVYAPALAQVDEVIQVGFSDHLWPHPRRSSVRSLDEVFAHVDFLFPVAEMALPGRPAASWIADLRHERIREPLAPPDRERRRRAARAIAEGADLLVLSSHQLRHDWQFAHPQARPMVRILPWPAMPQPSWFALEPAVVAARYGIREPFVICCNRFSVYKGLGALLDAVAALAARGQAPLVVCTGRTEDQQTPGLYQVVQKRLATLGIADRVRVLGFIPREEQMALMRASQAVLQPSLNEGWSTVVEEARALGKLIVLSDVEAHQEQAPPRGRYFYAGNAVELAWVLGRVLPGLRPGPSLADEEPARREAEARALAFARDVCALAREAIARLGARGPVATS
ncbi:MAG TPA: glycosyltransferase, partial [Polyangia bacterium]|nr:glycosyltransferase [Polyangia bacterium]